MSLGIAPRLCTLFAASPAVRSLRPRSQDMICDPRTRTEQSPLFEWDDCSLTAVPQFFEEALLGYDQGEITIYMTALDDGSSRFHQRSNIVTRAKTQVRRGGLGPGKALVAPRRLL